MVSAVIGIIFALIVLGVVWWAVQQLLPLIPLAEPFRTIVHVLVTVLAVIIVLWVIAQLLALAGFPVPFFR
jgi:uncharacterized membrane protein YwzB